MRNIIVITIVIRLVIMTLFVRIIMSLQIFLVAKAFALTALLFFQLVPSKLTWKIIFFMFEFFQQFVVIVD